MAQNTHKLYCLSLKDLRNSCPDTPGYLIFCVPVVSKNVRDVGFIYMIGTMAFVGATPRKIEDNIYNLSKLRLLWKAYTNPKFDRIIVPKFGMYKYWGSEEDITKDVALLVHLDIAQEMIKLS